MNINEVTRKDLVKMEYFLPDDDIYSVVILPTGRRYDGGMYGTMSYILLDANNNIVGKVGGRSDVIHINGIGGYINDFLRERLRPVAWRIDYLQRLHLVRLFCSEKLKIKGEILREFQVMTKEE